MLKRAVVFLLLCGVALPTWAEPTQDDLKRIEAQLRQERQTQKEAKRRSSELAGEIRSVQRQMVRSAQSVQEKEEVLAQLEEQLKTLQQKESELQQEIDLTDKQMVRLMTGLQTLALRPKELALLEPDTPVNALRSHLLMKQSLPIVNTKNKQLLLDLEELSRTKSEIEEKRQDVKQVAAQLSERTTQMNKLIKQKEVLQARYDESHKKAQKRIVSLASQAKDLKDLLLKLQAEKQRRLAEQRRRAAELAARQAATPKVAYTEPGYPVGVPSGSFQKARGSLSYPVRGQIVETFGATTASGAHAKGVTLLAAPGAHVIAPFDGTVLFSGPFKAYGQLLIIDNGDDYLTLLAGMEQMNAVVGQEVLAGEPIGIMKSSPSKLYIEIRKDGQAIDPQPWFRSR